jgi:acetoacetyl-CoA synthetase
MVTIEKAKGEDFERIYPLLLGFNSARLSKNDWQQVFINHWNVPEDYYGYILIKDGEVKGFLGAIFSTRVFNGQVERFCNMSSWIVDEGCRGQSLLLLLELLKLKDYTITNFTASRSVSVILQKIGFTPIETQPQLLLPVPSFSLNKGAYLCEFDREAIGEKLCETDFKIFEDHLAFNCTHILISSGRDYCYLIVRRIKRRRLAFAKVHYLSNVELFIKAQDSLRVKICLKLKVAGLLVAERYLKGHQLKYGRKFPTEYGAFYKSTKIRPDQIDTLYSEMILLHE